MNHANHLSGAAKLAGVMGWPVEHSRSPCLHGYWLNYYGIDGAYVPFAVKPDRLEAAIVGLRALGFRGCNVTIPHKEDVLVFVDELSDTARRVGAANTIIFDDDGRAVGDNTDGFGFIASLEAGAPWWRASDGPAVLLGAGGAARAISVALLDAGVPSIRLVNRTPERAEALANVLGPMVPGRAVDAVAWHKREDALEGAGLLVNTTSLGMTGQPRLELRLNGLPGKAIVVDIVYSPLVTELLAAARARGNHVIDGLGMLLHQARPGFAAWFGRDPEVTDALRDAVLGA